MRERELVKLKELIDQRGLKLKHIASRMGLTPYGLNLKLKGENEFKVGEANVLVELLGLTPDEAREIFLPSVFSENEQN